MQKQRVEIAGVPALLLVPERPRGAVLFFHGAGGHKERSARLLAPVLELGFLALLPDARHHGERGSGEDVFSDKRLIVEAQLSAIEEGPVLVRWLKDRFPELKLALMGASMGGYVVHQLLARGTLADAAVVWMGAALPPPWLRPYLPQGFVPALERAAGYRVAPLLHLHGEEDRIVPLGLAEETVKRLAEVYLPGTLGLLRFPGLAHTPTPEMAWLSGGWLLRWL